MKIAILGSTGSIGTQTLQVVRELNSRKKTNSNPHIEVAALAAGSNVEVLAKQALEFNVSILSVKSSEDAVKLKDLLQDAKPDFKAEIYFGDEGLIKVATADVKMLVTAIVGMIGLKPTLAAIDKGIDIALANKETLVVAGEIVMRAAKDNNVNILPVDSEHSAIFQALNGVNERDRSALKKIILTASGGPFRGRSYESLENVTLKETMNHPTWNMGSKITVDSATLMNKGLEVIEAMHLFGVNTSQIEVVVHPQSIVHSAVMYNDGSVIAQMGNPDMKVPIQLALTYPYRAESNTKSLDLAEIGALTFERPDLKAFPCLAHALKAADTRGTLPAVMNAANEVAVGLFIKNKIKFNDIQYIVNRVMDEHLNSSECSFVLHPSLEEILAADKWARNFIINNQEV
ncbi:MAG: 1-deoxy-D-xylulose-5-phosphate reductoisomerase [Ruminococcaceae bacterium]|nr:1-deoxy-D-xylulose-5-phosphate reductoisomerase [Oscillospiraceae bacterium]